MSGPASSKQQRCLFHLHRERGVPQLAAVVPLHLHAILRHPEVVVQAAHTMQRLERTSQLASVCREKRRERRALSKAHAWVREARARCSPRQVALEGFALGVLKPAGQHVEHLLERG